MDRKICFSFRDLCHTSRRCGRCQRGVFFFAAWHHSERKSIRIKEYPEDTGGGPLMQFDVGRYLGPPRSSEARLELHVKPLRHPKAPDLSLAGVRLIIPAASKAADLGGERPLPSIAHSDG